MLNELRAEFTRWQNEHAVRPLTDHTASFMRTPFTAEIMAQPYPLNLHILGNKEYDGRTDPEVHVNTYYGNMLMMGVSDAVMCRAFYSTLTGRAAECLAMKFNRKFVTSKVIQKPYMYLEKAKQLEGESLTEFLVKWKAAVGEVEPIDDLTAIHMLHISLRAGYLYQDFILHPPATYEEALRRVTDYANAGEANAVKRSQELLEDLLQFGKLDKCFGKREENKRVGERKDHRRTHHRSDRKDQDRRDPDPPSSSRPTSKLAIHVIFGGLEDASQARESCPVAIVDSRETGKRQKMEPITFSLEDQPESGDNGMEALVATIDIMGTDVQRVMVDTGSSVNVLYLDVFEKLKLDKRELIPVGVPLSGFTGATIRPERKIVLLVELGTPPKPVKTELEFVVVNLHCVHNVILGRPAIMRVGGIISLPHLCMKFSTPADVRVLRGDVQSARKCYSRAVNRRDAGSSRVNTIVKEAVKDRKEQPDPSEEIEEVPLSEE
ncbi:PREDICTED: uncharacterized protein LOC109177109 [Ipomoea nil]|uniref:uncharacterized protein LOC109177109 n=1 Tax=Ipomoea nil TaxID=35883 RepID=UPI000901B38B|nr:PREDICTED: uncharacterized protein LOC109177109 [Ipomoea nil]